MRITPNYLWWIKHAHTDSAFLTLMNSHEYFVHLVETKAKKLGRTDVQDAVNQATYRACFEQDTFPSMGEILTGVTAVPIPAYRSMKRED
jgi:hypothetical protein|tara:strand:- start:2323 stop:2592 length:270 start_codon:yes stop_codon:yes gene_type:complete